jgi:uncharacterized protein (TIRG00374 family)
MAARWHALALGLLTYRQALHYTMVGLFYGALFPGGVSGDVAKGAAIALKERATRTAQLPSSMIADRLIGLYVLAVAFCMACISLLANPPGASALLARLGAYGLILGAPVVLLLPLFATSHGARLLRSFLKRRPDGRVHRASVRVADALDAFHARPGVWLRALLLSAAVHACNVIVYLIILRALHLAVPVHLIIIMYAVLSVLTMIPISISGLGVREWFTLAFFPAIGLAAEAGVAFSLTYVALTWIVAAAGGAWHLLDLLPARRSEPADPT